MSSERPTSGLQSRRCKGGLILYDPRRAGQPDRDFFNPDRREAVATDRGRGSAWFLRIGDEEWVLRHYRRGGLLARWNRDAYIFMGWGRTRPVREIRLLAIMHAAGLPVPAPVAAGAWRSGGVYRGDLVTVRVPGQPLSHQLDQSAQTAFWRQVGALIGRFHAFGVDHADLNLHNILVSDDGRMHLIDFDRGRLHRGPGRWCRGNLRRLQRSLRKCLGVAWQEQAHWLQCWLALEQGWRERVSGRQE